ncbi:DUF4272 domain-containing protein [Kordia algicida OT-1]|uniref:DUF4272 domain-containing protein n=1 Tax=Kordia algicida OT-1 TaxID=391587 RepID=A9DUA5_9FLAO|nr:DUF4272 domain-containing protein [Kordia algicida]EDP96266.1 hypothetical protein KAOT1_02617 [Kordia algicida OT-1]
MICTFYSHETSYEKIAVIVRKYFPNADIFLELDEEFKIFVIETKGGFFSSKKILKIIYRERIVPNFQITNDQNCPLNRNLQGLYALATSIPIQNENLKERFLHKIHSVNCEFSVIEEKGTIKEIAAIIKDLALAYEAFLFVQDGTVISKANGQHFLDENLQLLTDHKGNSEIETIAVRIDPKFFPKGENNKELTAAQKERKARSEAILTPYKIRINRNLPCVEDESETEIRPAKEIAIRVTIMALINGFTLNAISGEDTIKILQKLALWEFVTPKEKHLLENPTDEAKNNESWKCEGIGILLWALYKLDEIPFPNSMINFDDLPPENYPLKDAKSFIENTATVRSTSEILDMNDLYYRMNWACVDARIKGQPMEIMIPGVVYERQYALNWLIQYRDQDWDNVSCDT